MVQLGLPVVGGSLTLSIQGFEIVKTIYASAKTQNSPQLVYFPSFPYKSGRLGAYRNRAGIPEADGVLVLFILNFWGSESSQNHSKCIQNESSTIIVAIPLYFHIGPGAWALIGTARDFRKRTEF